LLLVCNVLAYIVFEQQIIFVVIYILFVAVAVVSIYFKTVTASDLFLKRVIFSAANRDRSDQSKFITNPRARPWNLHKLEVLLFVCVGLIALKIGARP